MHFVGARKTIYFSLLVKKHKCQLIFGLNITFLTYQKETLRVVVINTNEMPITLIRPNYLNFFSTTCSKFIIK